MYREIITRLMKWKDIVTGDELHWLCFEEMAHNPLYTLPTYLPNTLM